MTPRPLRTLRRSICGTMAALTLLATTALSGASQTPRDGPTEYRDCWMGSPTHYDQCVEANNWGATFAADLDESAFPDPNDASLVIDGIPSY